MKEVILFLMIVLGVATLDVTADYYMDTRGNKIIESLTALKEDKNHDKMKKIWEDWENSKTMISSMIDHRHIDDIERSFSLIEQAIKYEETDDIQQKIEEAIFGMKDIMEKNKFTIRNLF